MRSSRDTVFIATLLVALIASTGMAFFTVTNASAKVTTTSGSFTGSTAGSSGGSGGGGGGGGGVTGGNQSAGVSGDTIKVGGIFSESGGIDSTVEEDTVRACFQMYNAQGGINGHKLTLVSYDDGLNADTAHEEAIRLVQQDNVFAVVGWLAPFGESSAAPYLEQNGVPIVGGLGVPEEFGNHYSFPVTPVFTRDGFLLGDYATNSAFPLKFKHPGVILTQTSGINDVANGIQQGAAKNGVQIPSSNIVFVSFTQANFDNYLLQFQSAGVDGLITQVDPFSYVRLYQSMQRTNKIFPHLAGAGIDKQDVDSSIGSPLKGTYSFMPVQEAQGNPTGNGEIALYNRTVATYYRNQVPNMDAFSEGSWVACRVFAQALAKLGAKVTRDGLVSALAGNSYNIGGMGPPLDYPAVPNSHAANVCATYIVYNGGGWTPSYNGFYCP